MRAGDESAFETFADHYIPALLRFAGGRLRGQKELTREVVQSTICKVIEKLETYRGEAPLLTWLCACCRNEIAGHYRRQQRRPIAVDIGDELSVTPASSLASQSADPEQQLLVTETGSLVHLALDHLPPEYASALEWKYLDGASVNEIGGRLNISVKAAESLLTRARIAFRRVYERLGEPREALAIEMNL